MNTLVKYGRMSERSNELMNMKNELNKLKQQWLYSITQKTRDTFVQRWANVVDSGINIETMKIMCIFVIILLKDVT